MVKLAPTGKRADAGVFAESESSAGPVIEDPMAKVCVEYIERVIYFFIKTPVGSPRMTPTPKPEV